MKSKLPSNWTAIFVEFVSPGTSTDGVSGTVINSFSTDPDAIPSAAESKASNDFNGDGKADILLYNNITGLVWLFIMDGETVLQSSSVTQLSDLNWEIKTIDDYNGDGKADIIWRNKVTGLLWVHMMDGTNIVRSKSIARLPNTSWDILTK